MSLQLVCEIANLCGPDPRTSRMDWGTDDMRSQYHALHYSTSRGKNFWMGSAVGLAAVSVDLNHDLWIFYTLFKIMLLYEEYIWQ